MKEENEIEGTLQSFEYPEKKSRVPKATGGESTVTACAPNLNPLDLVQDESTGKIIETHMKSIKAIDQLKDDEAKAAIESLFSSRSQGGFAKKDRNRSQSLPRLVKSVNFVRPIWPKLS